jgi:flagellar biogenesis protein FliO
MKTQRSRARVSAPRPALAPKSPAKPLLVFPGGTSLQTLQNAKGQFSRAWSQASERLSRAGKSAARVISCAWKNAIAQILHSWKCLRAQQIARSSSKRLQVAATASLGEKRFVAVIQVDGREFLVGGGATNVSLLAQLGAKKSFDGVLTETMAVSEMAVAEQPAKRMREKIAEVVAEQVAEQA